MRHQVNEQPVLYILALPPPKYAVSFSHPLARQPIGKVYPPAHRVDPLLHRQRPAAPLSVGYPGSFRTVLPESQPVRCKGGHRPEMYGFFYHNGKGHTNCFDHMNKALGAHHAAITPVNLFIHTRINADGSILIEEPFFKAGDKI